LPDTSHNERPTTKIVELHENWEEFTVKFSISHPINDTNDEMILDGNVKTIDYEHMHRNPQATNWMADKYGKPMSPWECQVTFPNKEGSKHGQWDEDSEFQKINYIFTKINSQKNIEI
jgi:hypothetical protein